MKTKRKFNWRTRLNALSKTKKGFVPSDFYALKRRAQEWPDCACGTLCGGLPRNADGSPQDTTLFEWGLQFYKAIIRFHWNPALRLFDRIERRSTKLLAEKIAGFRDYGIFYDRGV